MSDHWADFTTLAISCYRYAPERTLTLRDYENILTHYLLTSFACRFSSAQVMQSRDVIRIENGLRSHTNEYDLHRWDNAVYMHDLIAPLMPLHRVKFW